MGFGTIRTALLLGVLLAGALFVPRAIADTASADLAVVVTSAPSAGKTGGAYSYSFTVTNHGFDSAADVTATVALPTGAGIPIVSPSTFCTGGTQTARVCNLGALNNGDTRTITLNGRYESSGTFAVGVTLASTTADPDETDNAVTASTTVTRAQADLRLRLVQPVPTVLVGGFVDYLIEVENVGPDPVAKLRVENTSPASLAFPGATPSGSFVSCSQTQTVVNCNASGGFCSAPNQAQPMPGTISFCTTSTNTLGAGEKAYFRFTGRPTRSGSFLDITTVTAGEFDDPTPSNNSLETTYTVAPTANLALTASSPGSAAINTEFELALSVVNNGPDSAPNVRTTSTLPANATFVSGADCSAPSAATVVCDFGTIANGATAAKTITLRGTATGNATIASNAASDRGDNVPANNAASRTVTIVDEVRPPGADLAVTATGPATGKTGGSGSYAFVVTNNGFDDAANVAVTFSGPSVWTSFPVFGSTFCMSGPPGARVCNLGTLANGDSRTITYGGPFDTAGTIVVSATAASTTTDPDSTNNTASVSTTVARARADLRLRLLQPVPTVNVGGFVDYAVEVENVGPDPVGNVRVENDAPSSLGSPGATPGGSFVSCQQTPTVVNCNASGGYCSAPNQQQPVAGTKSSCWPTPGTLQPGQKAYFRFTGRPLRSGQFLHTTTVTATDFDDPAPANNVLETTFAVNATADLALTATAPGSAQLGQEFDLSLAVKNNGPDEATNVQTSTTLPANAVLVSGTGCTGTSTVVCSLGSVAVGATATATLRLRGSAAGNATVASSTTSDRADNVAANNTAPRTITILANAAPTVDAGGPYSVEEGSSGAISASGADANGDALTYQWDLDGDGAFETSGQSTTFSTAAIDGPATRTVGVRVCDPAGACATDDASVSITNAAPFAAIQAPASVTEGGAFALALTDATDPSPADTNTGFEFSFDCGDGSGYGPFSAAANHQCAAPADGPAMRTVRAKVRDKDGGERAYTDEVRVDNVAPTAAIAGAPATTSEGTSITLTGLASDAGAGDRVSLTWTVARNGVRRSAFDGTGSAFSFTPDDDGTWSIQLTASDGDGGSATATAIVAVTNVAPTARFVAPEAAEEGAQFELRAVDSTDPSAADVAAGLEYAFDCGSGYGTFGSSHTATCAAVDGPAMLGVGVKVRDKDGGQRAATGSVRVDNVAPTAAINGMPTTELEGTRIEVTGTADDPGTADTHTYSWRVLRNDVDVPALGGGGRSFAFTPDDDATWTVRLTVRDDDGAEAITSAVSTITNVAPTARLVAPASAREGTQFTISVVDATDAGAADVAAGLRYAFDCGSGFGAFGSATASECAAADGPASRAVSLKVRDKDGAERTYEGTVAIDNVAPTAELAAPAAVSGGESFGLSLTSASDPSAADRAAGFEYAFDCGSGYGAYSAAASASCATTDDGVLTVRGKLRDKDGAEAAYSTQVRVTNVAPECGAVTAPVAPVSLGTTIDATAPFTDPETGDTHSATIGWGDGSSTPGTTAGRTASGRHAYAQPGVFAVTFAIADDDGGAVQCRFEYVVVYDPAAGFVTGGGWIESPAGAYAPNPAATGRAHFGFVAKYERGSSLPSGQTQFQFKAGSLSFHSTAYDWLVVAGAQAKFKGSGTVNGVGGHRFLITGIDGQRSGGGGIDRFRIKIWNAASGAVVYDNHAGASDDSSDATVLGGGSITIHG